MTRLIRTTPRLPALAAALAVSCALALPLPVQAQDALSPEQRAAVEAIVRDYIQANPEIVLEALQAMQAREEAAAEQRQREALASLRDRLVANPDSPSTGPADADVVIVEFFDYQCGYCKRVLPDLQAVMADDPKLRVVWKEWPILGPMSEVAARAAIAVHRLKPDAYLAFHDTLMSERGRLTEQKIFQTATELGLVADQVRAEMAHDEVTAYLAGNQALAQQLGITGTPFFLIGDTAVPGAIGADQMRALIAEARAKKDG